MRNQPGRWEHSRDARHGIEQRGYEHIGAMVKRRRVRASMSQRELERLTGIDQSVISRLENGKQYGLRWSRFARLVGVLEGLDEPARSPTPWWVEMGITPPDYMLESLRAKGLIPAEPPADDVEGDA
jgi:transcriptional regulator with XRE-family HTH domain